MELIFKASAISVSAVFVCLLIKKTNPEIGTLLSLCAVTIIIFSSVFMLNGLKELRNWVERVCGNAELYIRPIIKCLGISLVTKMSADLCKDSGQASLASSLEFCGTVSAFAVVSPMLMSLLDIIGALA